MENELKPAAGDGSRKSVMWNIDDIYGDDLPPYHPGMNSSSEDGSSSSTSRGAMIAAMIVAMTIAMKITK